MVLAVSSPSPLWFMTRGTGAIALVLLTLTVALGVANVRRTRIGETPRFVDRGGPSKRVAARGRFVAVHIVTTLLDAFAPITLIDAVIPFARLPAAVARARRLRVRPADRDRAHEPRAPAARSPRLAATHWLAYVSWPVAVRPRPGTGSDIAALDARADRGLRGGHAGAVMLRISAGWPRHRRRAPVRRRRGSARSPRAAPLAARRPARGRMGARAGTPARCCQRHPRHQARARPDRSSSASRARRPRVSGESRSFTRVDGRRVTQVRACQRAGAGRHRAGDRRDMRSASSTSGSTGRRSGAAACR